MTVAETRSLLEYVQEQLASEETRLPVFDSIATRLRDLVANPEFSLDDFEETAGEDPGLVTEVLRHANSSFFRGLDKVGTVREAVMRLGASEVSNLVTAVTVRRNFRSDDPMLHSLMEQLWRHSHACAMGCRWLAQRAHDPALAARAFIAGLLHDAGKLLLLRVLDEVRSSTKLVSGGREIAMSQELVLSIIDSMHGPEGYGLLTRWNLPNDYATIARDHHAAEADPGNTLLAVVRLADAACHKVGVALSHDPSRVLIAAPEAQVLGLSEIALAELEIVLEDAARAAV
jgi:HD-like signal output (HDOD) protein